MPSTNLANAIEFGFQSLEDAFPSIETGHEPLASNYLVQVRRAKSTTKGGLFIPEEARKSEAANTTVGKVVAIGPICFKDPRTGQEWFEGPSFKVGDYLRIPRYGGFRFSVKWKDEEIDFVLFDHLQQLAKLSADPRTITAYL
jgi:co-chaperonin GroES (HSP10)